MNSPEAYIQFKEGMINDAGEIADASTAEFLRKYLEEFHQFVARVLTVLPRGA
jgi:chromate reductase